MCFPSGKTLPKLQKLQDEVILRKVRVLGKKYEKKVHIKSKINRRWLRRYLKEHPEKDVRFELITKGFSLGLKDDLDRSKLSQEVHNFINSRDDLIKMLDCITRELDLGYIVPGRGLYQLNLLCVPKKDSETGLMTKTRCARHGSYADAESTISLNDGITEESKHMIDDLALPTFWMYLVLFLQSLWISLRDLKDAFRQLLVALEDIGVIQYSLFGLSFVDLRQAYGVASASNRCQLFSQTLRWIVAHNASGFTDTCASVLIKFILAYIDDFTLGAPSMPECKAITACFDATLSNLNVDVSVGKNVDCTQVGVTNGIGFRLNTVPKTIFVPILKACDIIIGTLSVLLCHWIFGDAYECLLGRILYWARFDKRAKIFCNFALKSLQLELRKLSPPFKKQMVYYVPIRIRKALALHLRFFIRFREVPIVNLLYQPSISITAMSDASDQGGGFMCADVFCAYTFATQSNDSGVTHQLMDITLREAHAVLMLLWNMRYALTGRVLHLFVDNSSVEWGLRKCWAKSLALIDWIEEITALALTIHCELVVDYVPTFLNLPADMLSRGPAGRADFDRTARAFGWDGLVEIVISNHTCDRYYEDLRILKEPIQLPKWVNFVPKRKTRYANPELFKLWPKSGNVYDL